MALLPVADALSRLLELAPAGKSEHAALHDAAGRVLAEPVTALRTQPPFPASAMDGYAVRAGDIAKVPARLKVTGEAAAGSGFGGTVGAGEAVRIFTGAPVPDGADAILMQENAEREGDFVTALQAVEKGKFIRPAGLDFSSGEELLPAGRVLDAAALSLAAAANHPSLPVLQAPVVAILATGDELLPPGSEPGPGQIIASNTYGVAAIARDSGATVEDLGIVGDSRDEIAGAVGSAIDGGADILVTLGGASVGDHDLVQEVLAANGMELGFWRIAMRPGKPLMVGKLGGTVVLGLPGNPVSSIVCAHLFLKPLIAKLTGRNMTSDVRDALLAKSMPANDEREDYIRAIAETRDGELMVEPFGKQDSSMLKTLAAANCLIIRKPHAPAAAAGTACRVLMIR